MLGLPAGEGKFGGLKVVILVVVLYECIDNLLATEVGFAGRILGEDAEEEGADITVEVAVTEKDRVSKWFL